MLNALSPSGISCTNQFKGKAIFCNIILTLGFARLTCPSFFSETISKYSNQVSLFPLACPKSFITLFLALAKATFLLTLLESSTSYQQCSCMFSKFSLNIFILFACLKFLNSIVPFVAPYVTLVIPYDVIIHTMCFPRLPLLKHDKLSHFFLSWQPQQELFFSTMKIQ